MKTLTTYHNDPKFKHDFVRMTRLHRKQDRYISGQYQLGEGETFRGCSIGCSVRSLKLLGRNHMDYGDHVACANSLGWPEWLCRLQDTIFEGLPDTERAVWTETLAAAVPVGVRVESLDKVKWKFCVFLLKENIARVSILTLDGKLKKQVVSAIRQCLAVNETAIISGKWDESAARSAWSAAESAARSAWSAAESAWSAAESAARSVSFVRYRDELLCLLKKVK